VLKRARSLAATSKISQSHLMLSSINAMHLFQIGDYRRAYEAASICYSQFSKRNYVGIFGPLDSLFIIARCLLEFARPAEAHEKFVQIRDLAEQWNLWSWHFYADGYLARELAINGQVTQSIESIKSAHQRVSQIDFSHQLESILDMSEVFVRFQVNDFERLGVLLERAPKVRIVEQIRLTYDDRLGKKGAKDAYLRLPSKTPREKIWKSLVDASEVIDQENLAAKELKKALEVGALVGAKETFLRQSEDMGNLIIKLAGENPTVYMEDLASAVAERIKRNSNGTSEVRSSLTKREIEVLRHLSTERPISAIAATLHISINTMKTHLKNLYRKMDVENRTQAVDKAKANFILSGACNTWRMHEPVIISERLELHHISVVGIIELLENKSDHSAIAGRDFSNPHKNLIENSGPLAWRVPQVKVDPALNKWFVRFIVLKESREIIGSTSFHGAPDNEGMIEIGLGIEPAFQGKGYAKESLQAMWSWAINSPEVRTLRYTVSPDNLPSIAVIKYFGFDHKGQQMDDIDGPEDIYEISAVEFSKRWGRHDR
jgi:RimJ/RimL family protein N-acetyltransferase/DNA-binding CsgD family transcriptional regulator